MLWNLLEKTHYTIIQLIKKKKLIVKNIGQTHVEKLFGF